jgi:hypothetical protein
MICSTGHSLVRYLEEVSVSLQLGGLLARLESCLDTLEADVSLPADPQDEFSGEKQHFPACCAILQQAAGQASTSDFIRQVGLICMHSTLRLLIPVSSISLLGSK